MKKKKKSKNKLSKEIIICMILFILIMLILAVALYDFIPSSISLPESIEYTSDSTTTSIKQEIAYSLNEKDTEGSKKSQEANQELITSLKSYSIDTSDLNVYSEKNLYNSGNSNPFDYGQEETTNENGATTGDANNTNANSNSNTSESGTNANTSTSGSSNNSTTSNNNSTSNGNSGSSTSTGSNTKATSSTTGTFFESKSSK